MILIDTHTHLYLEEFDTNRQAMITSAIEKGITKMLLPNIDSTSIGAMLNLCRDFPGNCLPMMGLHPTSVKENFEDELKTVDHWLETRQFYAIGETGIDLYWDKTFQKEQEQSFIHQVDLAKKYRLPIVIHSRNSFDELFKILNEHNSPELTGVFHCFTGNLSQAEKIISMGFYLGIGGVITYKNSGLDKVINGLSLDSIVLETDSPYLPPVPYRGQRNESAYLDLIAQKVAEIKNISLDWVSEITSANAVKLFNL